MAKKYLVKITDSCPYLTLPFWFIAKSEEVPEIGMENSYKCNGRLNNAYPKCDKCPETRTLAITGLRLYTKKSAKELGTSGKVYELESLLKIP